MNGSTNGSHDYARVYVWEQPVRWFHWINATVVIVLGATGFGWLIFLDFLSSWGLSQLSARSWGRRRE